MPLPQEEIKRRIAAARLIRGMSQAEFDACGAADGFGKGEMSRVERGELQFREGKHLEAMRRYLDVPAWWFTAETIEMPDGAAAPLDDDEQGRLDRMEAQLAEHAKEVEQLIAQQNELLQRQSRILERIEEALDREDEAAKARDEESAARLMDAAQEAIRELRAASQTPGSKRRTRATSKSPQS